MVSHPEPGALSAGALSYICSALRLPLSVHLSCLPLSTVRVVLLHTVVFVSVRTGENVQARTRGRKKQPAVTHIVAALRGAKHPQERAPQQALFTIRLFRQ